MAQDAYAAPAERDELRRTLRGRTRPRPPTGRRPRAASGPRRARRRSTGRGRPTVRGRPDPLDLPARPRRSSHAYRGPARTPPAPARCTATLGGRGPPRPSGRTAAWTAAHRPAPSPVAPGRSSTGTATSAAPPAPTGATGTATGATASSSRPRRMPAGLAPVAVDRVAGLQPARVHRPGLGSRARRSAARSPAGSARRRPGCAAARLGAGLTTIPPAPAVDAAEALHRRTRWSPRTSGFCPSCGVAGRARSRDGQPGRTEGFCPTCRNPFSFTPKLQGRRPGRRPVRGRRRARPRRPGLDLPRPRPQRVRPLGGAQGPAQHRRRRRPRRRDRRAAVPRPGRAPAASSRSTTSSRTTAPATSSWSTSAAPRSRSCSRSGCARRAATTTRCRSTRRSPTSSRSCPRSSTCTTSACVYCDFKPDNVIQVGDAVKLIDLGGVRRLDDDDSAIYGTVGYQAPEVRAGRHRRSPPTSTRSGARCRCSRWSSAATRATYVDVAAAGRRDRRCSASTTRSTGCCSRPARPTRPTGSRRPTSCACSCSACCARSSPHDRPRALPHARPRPRCCSTCPGRSPTTRSTGSDLPRLRAGRRRPAAGLAAHRRASTTRVQRLARARAAPRAVSPRCCWPGPARRSRPVGSTGVDAGGRDALLGRRPVGVARGLDAGPRSPWRAGRRPRRAGVVQRRLRAGARRAGAQAGAGVRLRDAAARPDVAEALYRDLRAHRRATYVAAGCVRTGADPRGAR